MVNKYKAEIQLDANGISCWCVLRNNGDWVATTGPVSKPWSKGHCKNLIKALNSIPKQKRSIKRLARAVESVLISSEDGGDMRDIDWPTLQRLHQKYNRP